MKISQSKLKQLIREELGRVLSEAKGFSIAQNKEMLARVEMLMNKLEDKKAKGELSDKDKKDLEDLKAQQNRLSHEILDAEEEKRK